MDQLDRDSRARSEGSQRTRDYGSYQRSGGSRSSAGSYRSSGGSRGGSRGGGGHQQWGPNKRWFSPGQVTEPWVRGARPATRSLPPTPRCGGAGIRESTPRGPSGASRGAGNGHCNGNLPACYF